jgi:hypothetical protein
MLFLELGPRPTPPRQRRGQNILTTYHRITEKQPNQRLTTPQLHQFAKNTTPQTINTIHET